MMSKLICIELFMQKQMSSVPLLSMYHTLAVVFLLWKRKMRNSLFENQHVHDCDTVSDQKLDRPDIFGCSHQCMIG